MAVALLEALSKPLHEDGVWQWRKSVDAPAAMIALEALYVFVVQKGCKSVVVALLRALPKLLHGDCMLQWRKVPTAARR